MCKNDSNLWFSLSTNKSSWFNAQLLESFFPFCLSDCKISQLYSNGSKESVPCSNTNDSCHYIGRSESHPGSVVALSTCDGLVMNTISSKISTNQKMIITIKTAIEYTIAIQLLETRLINHLLLINYYFS